MNYTGSAVEDEIYAHVTSLTNLTPILIDAVNLVKDRLKFTKQRSCPNLNCYFPQNLHESEIQAFNLALKVPSRLKTEDDVAVWLLETHDLSRHRVAQYLTGLEDEMQPRTLEKLANGICSLDVGQDFVDGLKLFLPSTGCLLLGPGDDHKKEIFILAYARAHISVSQSSLLPISPGENVYVLADLTTNLLNFHTSISTGRQSLSTAINEFFAAMRPAVDAAANQLTMKTLMDICNKLTSGRPLAPLPVAPNLPSYLFADNICIGKSLESCSSDDNLHDVS